jgi:monoamine oxidase
VQATAILQQLYPAAYRPPAQRFVTRWGRDPYTCGAYSYCAVGCQEGDHAAIAAPEGLLYFAGEHCSGKRFGSMDGAYLSGLDAAKKLLSSAK